MIAIKFEVEGLDKLNDALQQFKGSLQDKIKSFLNREGAQLEREIKQELNVGGRTNATGPRGGRVVLHSLPGDPPLKQTGRLQASIAADVEVTPTSFTLDIGAIRSGEEVDYAGALEMGTSKMAPRPFLFPIVMLRTAQWPEALGVAVMHT